MKNKKLIICTLFLIMRNTSLYVYAQESQDPRYYAIVKDALKKGITGKKLEMKQEHNNKYIISLLGTIKTDKKRALKFVTVIYIFGVDNKYKHANGRLLIYDSRNRYLGSFYFGSRWDLPDKIENRSLIFIKHKEEINNAGCDQTTRISFKKGIPKQLYVSCTKKGGDLYTFEE